jgi:hypothetical protein
VHAAHPWTARCRARAREARPPLGPPAQEAGRQPHPGDQVALLQAPAAWDRALQAARGQGAPRAVQARAALGLGYQRSQKATQIGWSSKLGRSSRETQERAQAKRRTARGKGGSGGWASRAPRGDSQISAITPRVGSECPGVWLGTGPAPPAGAPDARTSPLGGPRNGLQACCGAGSSSPEVYPPLPAAKDADRAFARSPASSMSASPVPPLPAEAQLNLNAASCAAAPSQSPQLCSIMPGGAGWE